MKIEGNNSESSGCHVLLIESSCEECPASHLGTPIFEDAALPKESKITNFYACSTIENLTWPETLPSESKDCSDKIRRCVYYDEDIPNYVFVQEDKPPSCGGPCLWAPVWEYFCSFDSDCPPGLCCNGFTCDPCPTGSCCDDDGTCSQTTEGDCSGAWHEGVDCDDIDCASGCCEGVTSPNGNCFYRRCKRGATDGCGSPCDPDEPQPVEPVPDCDGGAPATATVTGSGYVANSGDPTLDADLNRLMNDSYVVDLACNGAGNLFINDSGYLVSVSVGLSFARFASITVSGLASMQISPSQDSPTTTDCGSDIYPCGGYSGSPTAVSGIGDFSGASIETSGSAPLMKPPNPKVGRPRTAIKNPISAASTGSWTGEWNLVQGCEPNCVCDEPAEQNPQENQIYETPCEEDPCSGNCQSDGDCAEGCYCCDGSCSSKPCGPGCCCEQYFWGRFCSDGVLKENCPSPGEWASGECLDVYECDEQFGCFYSGRDISGRTDCSECVVVAKVCDPYDPCVPRYAWGQPGSPEPPCPTQEECDRHWRCTSQGCQQDFEYTPFGYDQIQCEQACVRTFYCDNFAECQPYYDETFRYPYDTEDECREECKTRVYCDTLNGCLSMGNNTFGPESCEEISDGCKPRFYCDEYSGCMNLGWGALQEGETDSCDESSCVPFFFCEGGPGCSTRYYPSGVQPPEGSYDSIAECGLDPSEECSLPGCTNRNSPDYNPRATCDDGSCRTCCNQGKCILDDESPCKGLNCNRFAFASGCCDAGCLPCFDDIQGVQTGRDCDDTFDNSFTANGCDGATIVYHSCYNCPSS
jgi:hypothetical protein